MRLMGIKNQAAIRKLRSVLLAANGHFTLAKWIRIGDTMVLEEIPWDEGGASQQRPGSALDSQGLFLTSS